MADDLQELLAIAGLEQPVALAGAAAPVPRIVDEPDVGADVVALPEEVLDLVEVVAIGGAHAPRQHVQRSWQLLERARGAKERKRLLRKEERRGRGC